MCSVLLTREPNKLLTAKAMRYAIKRKLYVFVMSENLVDSADGITFNLGDQLDSVEEELVDRKLEKASRADWPKLQTESSKGSQHFL